MRLFNVKNVLSSIAHSSDLKSKRSFMDLYADRIRVAASSERELGGFINRLAMSVNGSLSEINQKHVVTALAEAGNAETQRAVLGWLRDNSALAAMLAFSKREDCQEALDAITINPSETGTGKAPERKPYQLGIELTAETAISHGSDMKGGNSTLFRRMQVLTDTGSTMELPYIAGNALRGQLRDIIADRFLSAMGLTPRKDHPPVALWFFHALYSGGALTSGKEAKAVDKLLGSNGALKTEGLHTLRDTLPMVSLLGCALTNRIIPGRIEVGDLRPRCEEWNNGEHPACNLMGWTFLTRREDHENHEAGENSAMIANTEVLKPGTKLEGGIDLSPHISDVEASCLGDALEAWQESGMIGAQNARGLGRVNVALKDAPDGELYRDWLAEKKEPILQMLTDLGALNVKKEGE